MRLASWNEAARSTNGEHDGAHAACFGDTEAASDGAWLGADSAAECVGPSTGVWRTDGGGALGGSGGRGQDHDERLTGRVIARSD